jgi:hypothetical protein
LWNINKNRVLNPKKYQVMMQKWKIWRRNSMYTVINGKVDANFQDLDALLEELKLMELEQSRFVEH